MPAILFLIFFLYVLLFILFKINNIKTPRESNWAAKTYNVLLMEIKFSIL